ncbi:MAG TPA: MFS transporter, partial [Cytophagaceae bacterium]
VNKEQLASAIALNSGIFNAARAIGPGVAGLLIVAVGTGGAFIINGVTYAAVIMALAAMNITSSIPTTNMHPVQAIKEGIQYSANHPIIKNLLLFAGMVSVFGWSYTTLLPLIAKTEFKLGAAGLGYFYTAGGLGSLTAAILVAILSQRISAIYFIIGGNFLLSSCLFLFTLSSSFYMALFFLFLTGMGLVAQASTINSTVQSLVKPEFRGRVMSIYVLMFIGLIPLGNLQIGWISEQFGVYFAIRLGCIILFTFGAILFYFRNKIRHAYSEYKNEMNG